MRKILYTVLVSLSVCFAFKAFAEGLPANPWAKGSYAVDVEKAESDADKLAQQAVDMWDKVRDSKEFRQWKMPDVSTKAADKKVGEQNNLLTMLSNLNQVGYKMPSNYKNIVSSSQSKSKKSNFSYDQMMRQWQQKYNNTKNNSLNIMNNSYHRMLSTIRNSTGVDVNRVINESVNAFK